MNIEYVSNKTMAGYLECVKDLNREGVAINDLGDAVIANDKRNTNILTLIGKVDEEIVATATMIIEKKLRYQPYCCHIEDVAVRADKRGRGYGQDIVEKCVEAAKGYGCYRIKLNCSDDLVEFYENIGFEKSDNHMVIDTTKEV